MFNETGSISRPDGFQQLFAYLLRDRPLLGHNDDEIGQENRPHGKAVQNQVKQTIINDHMIIVRSKPTQPQNLHIAWLNIVSGNNGFEWRIGWLSFRYRDRPSFD